MNAMSPSGPLTLAELERILTGIDPSVLLVALCILRRVIKQDRALEGFGLQVPHHKSYVIFSGALLRIADRGELRLARGRYVPETLILLPLPDEHQLHEPATRGQVLREYWRLLFHARVHKALQDRIRAGQLDDPALRQRVSQIGLTEFAEIESVLRQENFLLPPGDRRTVYEEFASLYLELKFFQPRLLPQYFPTITRFETIDRVLAQDLAAEDLWQATQVPGSETGGPHEILLAGQEDSDERRWWYRHLIGRAERRGKGQRGACRDFPAAGGPVGRHSSSSRGPGPRPWPTLIGWLPGCSWLSV